MRTTISVIISLLILSGCKQKPTEEKTLVFPTGRYTNLTNFELIHIAFRLQDEGLAIDNNYDFELKIFAPTGFEKPADYPATTEFLKKTLNEYHTLSQNRDTSHCAQLTPVYIAFKNGGKTDLISFKTVAECNSTDSLPRIVGELWTLRQKYAR